MTLFLLTAGGVIVALIAWMIVRAVRLTLATATVLRAGIEPALEPLREGRTPSPDQIHELAAHATTRSTLWRMLRQLGRADLFPSQYATAEALAESDMAVWLMHGNEVGAPPDQIELVQTIDRPDDGGGGGAGRYYLFRFRTSPSHSAGKSGWMAGIAGPYAEGEEAFDAPGARVFSRFEPFDARTPAEHLAAIAPERRPT